MKRVYKLIGSMLFTILIVIMPMGATFFNTTTSIMAISSVKEQESSIITETEQCICTQKCTSYDKNNHCELCDKNYEECGYIGPDVKVTITTPSGWHNDNAKVYIRAEDLQKSGKFQIVSMEAKVSTDGEWKDIKKDKYIEIVDNCTVYVQIKDQNGKTYLEEKYVQCFDKVKPTIQAAINNGELIVNAVDTHSGISKIYVNSYEFTELTDDAVNIRLQQFDAGYENFTLKAIDKAGNISDVYKLTNPYYTDPTVEKDSSNTSNAPKEQLPVSASPTKPTNAKATITEHTSTGASKDLKSDSVGTVVKENDEDAGKEFYTIQTKSEKVFYLVIDKAESENNVYLLTEVSENDLLNFSDSTSQVLPLNSAVVESALPKGSSTVENTDNEKTIGDGANADVDEKEESDGKDIKKNTAQSSNTGIYIMMLLFAAGVGVGGYYLKFIKGKKDSFDEEDDLDEDEQEEYERDDNIVE